MEGKIALRSERSGRTRHIHATLARKVMSYIVGWSIPRQLQTVVVSSLNSTQPESDELYLWVDDTPTAAGGGGGGALKALLPESDDFKLWVVDTPTVASGSDVLKKT